MYRRPVHYRLVPELFGHLADAAAPGGRQSGDLVLRRVVNEHLAPGRLQDNRCSRAAWGFQPTNLFIRGIEQRHRRTEDY